VGYTVVSADAHEWIERPTEGRPSRYMADVTGPAALSESRARLWRLPPHTRGRRHKERVQEEVFVVLAGTLTVLLDDPHERFDVPAQSIVRVEPGTAVQLRNEGESELVVFAYGAPPVPGEADYLDDVEL
jgi:mannose-6-phosphate isomerase-like protein (cupin superfamily)